MSIRSTKHLTSAMPATLVRCHDHGVEWFKGKPKSACANENFYAVGGPRPIRRGVIEVDGHPVLTTARFTLKPMTQRDALALADLGADPDVVKTLICDWSTPERRLAIARTWIESDQTYGIWGVYDRDGAVAAPGQFIGFCAVDDPLPRCGQGPEVYYAFSRVTWGRSVATEVVAEVVRHLFDARGVDAVEALVLAGMNPASRRLLERQGMRLIGRYPHIEYAGEQCTHTIRYELWRVATASRRHALRNLEEAAFKIGQFVVEGVESHEAMVTALNQAAVVNGLTARLGAGAVDDIVNGSLRAGMREEGWLYYRITRVERTVN